MADPYVIFPGTAGNYASTADVNLLDADTAHTQGGVGNWVSGSSGAVTVSQSGDGDPGFGDYTLKTLINVSAAVRYVNSGTLGSVGNPVSAATEYTFSLNIKHVGTASPNADFTVYWMDAAYANISNSSSTDNTPITSAWGRFSYTVTSPALAAFVVVQVRLEGNDVGDIFYFDEMCLRVGTDPTFVPSLRIVGTRDRRITLAPPIWFPGTQVLAARHASGQASWNMQQRAAGVFRLVEYYNGGSALTWDTSDMSAFVTDGVPSELRWLTSPSSSAELFIDGVSRWSNTAGAITYDLDGGPLTISDYLVGNAPYLGDVYSYEERDSDGGPIVASFQATDIVLP